MSVVMKIREGEQQERERAGLLRRGHAGCEARCGRGGDSVISPARERGTEVR